MNAFEHRRVRPDPDIVVDDHRSPRDFGPRPSFAQGRAGNRVRHAGRGRERVKIGVGYRRVPTDHDVAADAQFEFTEQDGIGEVAVVANPHLARFAECKMNAVHCAIGPDDQRVRFLTVKPFEGKISGDERVGAYAGVWRGRDHA